MREPEVEEVVVAGAEAEEAGGVVLAEGVGVEPVRR